MVRADETIVSAQFDRPVMVHRYPAEVKAFYMKRDPENAQSMHLLLMFLHRKVMEKLLAAAREKIILDFLVRKN
ncbi:MAG: hypothetical protein MZV64_47640 [Ignavibacteriales bacterium]|nr:hypothetical protein [Ignavibacteriales bacterium]